MGPGREAKGGYGSHGAVTARGIKEGEWESWTKSGRREEVGHGAAAHVEGYKEGGKSGRCRRVRERAVGGQEKQAAGTRKKEAPHPFAWEREQGRSRKRKRRSSHFERRSSQGEYWTYGGRTGDLEGETKGSRGSS